MEKAGPISWEHSTSTSWKRPEFINRLSEGITRWWIYFIGWLMAVSSNTASVSLAVHSERSFGLSALIGADAGLHVALLSRRAAPQGVPAVARPDNQLLPVDERRSVYGSSP